MLSIISVNLATAYLARLAKRRLGSGRLVGIPSEPVFAGNVIDGLLYRWLKVVKLALQN